MSSSALPSSRVSLRSARWSLLIVVPVGGCPDPSTPADGTGSAGDSGSTGTSNVDSSSGVETGAGSTGADTTLGGSDSTTAVGSGSTTAADPCGNGMLDPGEDCDGRELDGQDCLSMGFDRGQLACADDCSFDASSCTMAVCGDGVVEGTEPCDGDDTGVLSCEAEGFYGGTIGCTEDCMPETSGCTTAVSYCSMAGFTLIEVGTLVIPVMVPPVAETVVGVDISLEAMHSFVGFLDVSVEHTTSATAVQLLDNLCGPEDDIDAVFDQDALAPPDCVAPIAVEDHVLPVGDLGVYAGLPDQSGQWELTIVDSGPGDTDPGLLVEWCVVLEVLSGGM